MNARTVIRTRLADFKLQTRNYYTAVKNQVIFRPCNSQLHFVEIFSRRFKFHLHLWVNCQAITYLYSDIHTVQAPDDTRVYVLKCKRDNVLGHVGKRMVQTSLEIIMLIGEVYPCVSGPQSSSFGEKAARVERTSHPLTGRRGTWCRGLPSKRHHFCEENNA